MIYPALTYLEEIGHAAVAPEGKCKLYASTEAGRLCLEAKRAQADTILDALARVGGRMDQVREAFAGVGDPDPQAADALHRARHALIRTRGAHPKETNRIARILEMATARILKIPT